MREISFPYGKKRLSYSFCEEELEAVLESSIENYEPKFVGEELIRNALENPIGSKRLSELSVGKKNVVVISSDHTRPVPSKIIMPLILAEIRKGNPDANITILIATGCHRGTTANELKFKFGEEIMNNEKIVVHDCDDESILKNIGKLPSGGDCFVNKIAADADLLVAEGFIEPHLFAGFTGGRKSILPGVSSRRTVMYNHCAEFIDSPYARTGILENNPVHRDMLWAAKTAGLKFIVNVVINDEKKPIFAVAGDLEKAHKAGTDFISGLCKTPCHEADIAISTNGGYPLDQNVYQAAKGMTAAEAAVKKGGVVIMLSESEDGTGGDYFDSVITGDGSVEDRMNAVLSRNALNTVPDQWQAQIILRVLLKATVIYVSEIPDETVRAMDMIPAHSLDEAISTAKKILNKKDVKIIAIPNGTSVIVQKI